MRREFAGMKATVPDLRYDYLLKPMSFLKARLIIKHVIEFLHDCTQPILESYKLTELKNAARQEWEDATTPLLKARYDREKFPQRILDLISEGGVSTHQATHEEREIMQAAAQEYTRLDNALLSMPVERRLSTKMFLQNINDEALTPPKK